MHDGRAGLVVLVLVLGDPHLAEGGEGRQGGAADPGLAWHTRGVPTAGYSARAARRGAIMIMRLDHDHDGGQALHLLLTGRKEGGELTRCPGLWG